MIKRPMHHSASSRNRKKSLHHAKCLLDELEFIDCELRRMIDEHIAYALGRVHRLVNRLHSEVKNDKENIHS